MMACTESTVYNDSIYVWKAYDRAENIYALDGVLVEIRIPKKFSVSFYILTDRKFLRNPNLNEIWGPRL